MSMIEVRDLTKYFGQVLAVDHVSFAVEQGEVVGFLGLNGAGKTTTMRILTTFLPATSGTASVAGFDVMTQSMDVRKNLGYLPENVPLYSEMRVEEYLSYRARLKGVERRGRRQRVEYCMERCYLIGVRRRLLGTLSRGFRQRVGLAEALIHDPPILIMDEPTGGLDPIQIQETLNLIRDLGEQHTILLSTHILSEVERACGRVIIITRGRITLDDTLANLQKGAGIVLEVRGPAEQVETALRNVKGVTRVARHELADAAADGISGYEVHTDEDADLRIAIAETVARQGWSLRRLDLRRGTLQEHFTRASTGAGA